MLVKNIARRLSRLAESTGMSHWNTGSSTNAAPSAARTLAWSPRSARLTWICAVVTGRKVAASTASAPEG